MLRGTYFAASGLKGNIFTLSTTDGGCFSKAVIGNVPANSVYLELGDDAPTGHIALDFSDEPAGIKTETADVRKPGGYYDMQGRKVTGDKPMKGLYIHDGKVVKQ